MKKNATAEMDYQLTVHNPICIDLTEMVKWEIVQNLVLLNKMAPEVQKIVSYKDYLKHDIEKITKKDKLTQRNLFSLRGEKGKPKKFNFETLIDLIQQTETRSRKFGEKLLKTPLEDFDKIKS